jgi:hypothetical protein
MKRILALAFLAFVLGGCNGLAEYVDADDGTRLAIDPEYRAYVAADPNLSPEQKQRRLRLLESWRLRIEKAKENAR